MMPKGIIFDLDDTLYDYEMLNELAIQRLCLYSCHQFHITPDYFYKAFEYGRNETKCGMRECASQHNRLIYCQKTLEYMGINSLSYSIEMYEVYWSTILEKMELNDGVLNLMKRLKKEKILIAICTDLTSHIQHRKLRKLNIQNYIDVIVTSEEAGEEKPNPKIFELTLDKMNLSPYEVYYVGDSFRKDIVGANKLNIKSFWFNKNNNQPYEKIDTYIEIKDFIRLEWEIFHEQYR